MLKGEIINGYTILEDFVIAGGQSKISFAEKEGVEYFIKEFLQPKFPVEGSPGSAKRKEKKMQECLNFERHHQILKDKISSACSTGGNLVYTVDFFRAGTSYYKINEKIDVSSISINEISKLPENKKYLILITICHSLKILHSNNIVHGDLKPDNVLIKKTETGSFTSKLIDFDDSYFSKHPPSNTEIVADPTYYSPELGRFIIGDSSTKSDLLTVKSDIFSIGIVFCQYLTGNLPLFDTEKYEYAWEAVNNKQILDVRSIGLKGELADLLNTTFSFKINDRPSIQSLFDNLKKVKKGRRIDIFTDFEEEIIAPPKKNDETGDVSKTSKLKGSLLKVLEKDNPSKKTKSKLIGKLLKNLDKRNK